MSASWKRIPQNIDPGRGWPQLGIPLPKYHQEIFHKFARRSNAWNHAITFGVCEQAV